MSELDNVMDTKLPNVSSTIIRVNTKFKPQIEDGEDFRMETIKSFHNAVHEWIDEQMTENDEFEQQILEIMSDNGELPKGAKEFLDLGEISVQVIQEEVVVKQKDLSDDEAESFLAKKRAKKVDKAQTKLGGLT